MFDVVIASEPLLITLEKVLELMKQMSWKTGFSIEFFCGNPAMIYNLRKVTYRTSFFCKKAFHFGYLTFLKLMYERKHLLEQVSSKTRNQQYKVKATYLIIVCFFHNQIFFLIIELVFFY